MVILAIPSMKEGGLNDEISPRFGRCSSFTFIELENDEIKAVKTVPNHAANAMGGAGVQATQIIGNNNAEVAIVGFLGPNAANGLNALNIEIFNAPNERMTIKEAIDLYKQGKLKQMSSANVVSHYGMGGGRSRGSGRDMGGGRGMGRGNRP